MGWHILSRHGKKIILLRVHLLLAVHARTAVSLSLSDAHTNVKGAFGFDMTALD